MTDTSSIRLADLFACLEIVLGISPATCEYTFIFLAMLEVLLAGAYTRYNL